jgi:hypothetical protein
LSEKHNAFLRPLKNKGFKEESMTKFGVDAIGMSTTLESNKSPDQTMRAIERDEEENTDAPRCRDGSSMVWYTHGHP